MIVDSHAHIFPFLGSPSGFSSVQEHMHYLQVTCASAGGSYGPIRPKRLRDHSIIREETLVDAPPDGPRRLRNVGFRVEENGRFVWRHQGEDVYVHLMPPSLQSNASPPEFILAQMAHAGVDIAVLQNASPYGRLNEYFAAAIARYPGKLVGLAEVDEPNADSETELRDLRIAVRELGLRGLYYETRGFFWDNYRHNFDHRRYEVFWETVRMLKTVVFWELKGIPVNTIENQARAFDCLDEWSDRYPDIPSIITHGVHPDFLTSSLPESLQRVLGKEQFWVELLYPINWGGTYDYPYSELRPAVQELYRRVGAQRLIWGSDMPNVERFCTYRQSLDYLRKYCDFISSSDMDQILGGNLAGLFDLK